LEKDFSIMGPKIAVLAINPHASDDGLIGNDEKNTIIPAIESVKSKGITAMGPFPADGFFGEHLHLKYDAVLAMYHDQGLIPFKTLSYGKGVNYTAGLPIIRTSPAHGTAYGIAGQNIANENSFRESIFLAIKVMNNRAEFAEANADPLKVRITREKEADNQA
jgi:4-hydroxythreonine-4-phosphate dehydrogenase